MEIYEMHQIIQQRYLIARKIQSKTKHLCLNLELREEMRALDEPTKMNIS